MTTRNAKNADKLGRYYTDRRLADAILWRCKQKQLLKQGQVVLEPSSGGGAFLDAIFRRMPPQRMPTLEEYRHSSFPGIWKLYAMDISPDAPSLKGWAPTLGYTISRQDFLDPYPTDWEKPDLIIGNPPYSIKSGSRWVDTATLHCEKAIALAKKNVVFLLRTNFLGCTKLRRPFWEKHPPKEVWMIDPRPSFSGGGTDSTEYSVFWWENGWEGKTTLSFLRWK